MRVRSWSMGVVILALAGMVVGCTARQPADEAPSDAPAEASSIEAVTHTPEGTRVALTVTGDGFVPTTVTVPVGKPVTLAVTRKTEKTCATELVMKEHNIHLDLPLDRTVEVTFTPDEAGELRYACAMDMIAGKIIVE